MNNNNASPQIEHIFRKGQNPTFDRLITRIFHYAILSSFAYSIILAFMPYELVLLLRIDDFAHFVIKITNFFDLKYDSLEYAEKGLGLKYIFSISISILISTSISIYTIFVVIIYWIPENNEWHDSFHFTIPLFFLFNYIFCFYMMFIFDSSLEGVKYPGALIYMNSGYVVVLTSVIVVYMGAFWPAFTAYILKLVKFRGDC